MRTTISGTNPFGPDRYGFLWEVLREAPPGRHLDYGAFDGATLSTLHKSGVVDNGVGVDANRRVVAASASSMPPGLTLIPIAPRSPLPFEDASFDSASLLDVIEHIVDQRSLLVELGRVVRPGGVLIVTVPQRHTLSFLDTGNWKFRFRRLHRVLFTLARGRAAYQQRYIDCEDGLYGDIEVGKNCHQHFDVAELAVLLRSGGFEVRLADGAGQLARLLLLIDVASGRLLHRWLESLMRWDARRFGATHLFTASVRIGNLASSTSTPTPT